MTRGNISLGLGLLLYSLLSPSAVEIHTEVGEKGEQGNSEESQRKAGPARLLGTLASHIPGLALFLVVWGALRAWGGYESYFLLCLANGTSSSFYAGICLFWSLSSLQPKLYLKGKRGIPLVSCPSPSWAWGKTSSFCTRWINIPRGVSWECSENVPMPALVTSREGGGQWLGGRGLPRSGQQKDSMWGAGPIPLGLPGVRVWGPSADMTGVKMWGREAPPNLVHSYYLSLPSKLKQTNKQLYWILLLTNHKVYPCKMVYSIVIHTSSDYRTFVALPKETLIPTPSSLSFGSHKTASGPYDLPALPFHINDIMCSVASLISMSGYKSGSLYFYCLQ